MQSDNQQDNTTLTITLQPQNDHRKAIIESKESLRHGALGDLSMYNAHAYYPQDMYGHPRQGALDLCNGGFRENATNILTFVAS